MCSYKTFAPNITSERLTLRAYRPEDAARVRALANNIAIARMIASIPYPYPEGLAEEWIATHPAQHAAGKGIPFAIEIGGEVAGSIGVERGASGDFELGYWLGEPYWGHGYASEAAAAAMSFAFELEHLPYVRARVLRDNGASARVLTKTGFLATGRYTMFHKVRACDVEVTATILTRDAWASNRV